MWRPSCVAISSRAHWILRCALAVSCGVTAPHASVAQTITSIKRASLAPETNRQGESYSYDPSISGDGRYVTFTSTSDSFAATGKVEGELHEHAYVRDMLTGETTQLDITSAGRSGSPSGSFNPNVRVFRSSLHSHMSRDGTYVAFASPTSDISPDGAGETFGNWVYLKNLQTGAIQRIPYATAGDLTRTEYPTYLAIDGDGSKVVVISIIGSIDDTNCTNCAWELTLCDRDSNTTQLIDTGVAGNKFNPVLSDDGRYVVFENQVGDFSGPTYSYLYDFQTAELTPLNNGAVADSPTISGDGSIIAYSDTSVVPTQLRLRDRVSTIESLVSPGVGGAEPNGIAEFASLSEDGRYTAFLSTSSNLVEEDTNGSDDIFVFDRITGKTTLVSVQGSCQGIATTEDFNTGPPAISSDGKTLTFAVLERLIAADQTNSSGRVTERADTNRFDDVYVATIDYDAQPDTFRRGLTPTKPFVSVNCTGALARVIVEQVEKPSSGAIAPRVGSKAKTVREISQEIVISKINAKTGRGEVRKRLVTKRNQITTRGLAKGTYSVQVRAQAKLSDGSKVVSKFSKGSKFVISK